MQAIFGLMFFRGLFGLNSHRVSDFVSERSEHPVFGGTMSRNRFKFLIANLCFDDIDTRADWWQTDRFAAFRQLFQCFNEQCTSQLVPQDYLSLDETLYPMRNQISFQQYNPRKPAKYGLLLKSLNDTRFSYTYRSLAYAGKPMQLSSAQHISGTENYMKELVNEVNQTVALQGRNISMDRLYTSISIAYWLLEKNITCVGTMLNRRVGIPEEVKTIKGREEKSPWVFWKKDKGNLALTSYVVGTATGKKNVLVLSTV